MDKVYAPCQCCSALGVVGERCEFCGNTIVAKDNTNLPSVAVPSRRSIPAEEFAHKITKYHEVESFNKNVAIVSIGDLCGVINKNGDIIIPLDYEAIEGIYGSSILKLYSEQHYSLFDVSTCQFLTFKNGDKIEVGSIQYGCKGQLIIEERILYDLEHKEEISYGIEDDVVIDAFEGGYLVSNNEGLDCGYIRRDGSIVFYDKDLYAFDIHKVTVHCERYKGLEFSSFFYPIKHSDFDSGETFFNELFAQLDDYLRKQDSVKTLDKKAYIIGVGIFIVLFIIIKYISC